MRSLIFSLVLLSAAIARAEDPAPVQDIPPGDDQIEVLVQGKPAPFTGQLFSQETALRWANWLNQYKARLKSDVELEKAICKAETTYRDKLLAIEVVRGADIAKDQKQRMLRLEQYNAQLQDKINNPSFWHSMEFGLILGALSASAVAVAVGVAAANN
jgi:hypothetical protein